MGSFEKLGILVIVVIIVMILTVAIYQWGGAGLEGSVVGAEIGTGGSPAPGIIDVTPPPAPPAPSPDDRQGGANPSEADSGSWLPGIPREYVIKRNDAVWKVVLRWGLRESFIAELQKANPGVNFAKLKIGERLRVPDPTDFVLKKKAAEVAGSGYRIYRVKQGDNFEFIARDQLGSAARAKEIQALNPGVDSRGLRIDQELRIPLK